MKTRYLVLIIGFFLVGLSAFFWWISYEEFTYQILAFYHKEERLQIFRNQYLTVQKFVFLRYASIVFVFAYFFLSSFLTKKINQFILFIQEIYPFFVQKGTEYYQEIRDLSTFEKRVFWGGFVFFLLSRIYYIIELPFFVDEAFSYLFFVDKGFLVTMTYYPGPNNHILYNLFANFLALFSENGLFVMRFPSFCLSIILYFLLFIFVKKQVNVTTALVSIFLLNQHFSYHYYAVSGRGYLLYLGCFVLCLYTFFQDKKRHQLLYIFFAVLGFYTIPTFIYAIISFFVIGFFLGKNPWDWFKNHLLIAVIGIMLYLPVFLVSGVGAVTNNSWVAPLSWNQFLHDFFEYILLVFNWFINIDSTNFVGILLFLLVLLFNYKEPKARVLGLFFVIPFVVLFFQKVLPFTRIWIYLLVVQSLLGAIFLNKIVLKKSILMIFCAICMLLSVFQWQKEFQHGFGVYDEIPKVSNYLLAQNARNIYIEEDTYNILIRFAFQQEKKEIEVDVDFFDEEKKYEFMFLKRGSIHKSENYQAIIEQSTGILYQKIKK